jgi:hypothetical protein
MSVEAPERSGGFPDQAGYLALVSRRARRGRWARVGFLGLLVVAVIALAAILFTIIDDSFGLVAIVNQEEPEAVVARLGYDPAQVGLAELPKEDLVGALQAAVTNNVGRRLERDQRFFADHLVFEDQATWDEICVSGEPPTGCTAPVRDQQNVYLLVQERIIQPDIIASNGCSPPCSMPPRSGDAHIADTLTGSPLHVRPGQFGSRGSPILPHVASEFDTELAGIHCDLFVAPVIAVRLRSR